MAEEPSLADEKWVRIMGEYVCEGVWDRSGACCCADDLPISEKLRKRLVAWAERYNDYDYMEQHQDDFPFDLISFAQDGLEIARAVKAELPDWTVIYHDEAKTDFRASYLSQSTFEYEV